MYIYIYIYIYIYCFIYLSKNIHILEKLFKNRTERKIKEIIVFKWSVRAHREVICNS